jgi:hypothetical protein
LPEGRARRPALAVCLAAVSATLRLTLVPAGRLGTYAARAMSAYGVASGLAGLRAMLVLLSLAISLRRAKKGGRLRPVAPAG